ncbi:dihydroneopterin aldolase family protein [Halomarina ordinaria]|uniref:Dihydroneopterin aldolase n=1 Tax=Halomarina ordinaria TaxID=3033939 RepID=A0ABD5U8P3_9EURY|nr:dihydroneopterin aldolase family protein [Halomarina sp. PSRA2]
MDPTEREVACFEAGIKFGTLYHQFAGTPVSPESAASLERAMEAAVENQPHCTAVDVAILVDELDTTHDYTELTGRYMEVHMRIDYGETVVRTEMRMEDGYPMMRVVDVHEE